MYYMLSSFSTSHLMGYVVYIVIETPITRSCCANQAPNLIHPMFCGYHFMFACDIILLN